MDKRGITEKILIIGGIWVVIVCLLYLVANSTASDVVSEYSHSEITWRLFGIYLGQTVQLVFYFMMPILLFFIAWDFLKINERPQPKEPVRNIPEKQILIRTTKRKRTQKD